MIPFFVVVTLLICITTIDTAAAIEVYKSSSDDQHEEVDRMMLRVDHNQNSIKNDGDGKYIYKDQLKVIRRQIDERMHHQEQEERMNNGLKSTAGSYHRRTKESIDPKLGQILSTLVDIHNTNGPITRIDSLFLNSKSFVLLGNNTVLIDIVGNIDVLNENGGDIKALLLKDGYEVINCFKNICSMYVPIDQLVALSTLTYVQFARPAVSETRSGLATSEGDVAMLSDQIRSTYNVDGSGLIIGVMSDSFNCQNLASKDIDTGDLPNASNIIFVNDLSIAECNVTGNKDEGRAMMQLIYDVAPGAQVAFRTALRGAGDFAIGIYQLAKLGCDIIVDDIGVGDEPFYQDGTISQIIDDVVSDGVLYFSAIGNSGNNSWIAPNGFVPSGISNSDGEYHQFFNGDDPIIYQNIKIPNGNFDYRFSFQWSEPFYSVSGRNGSRSDIDIYFFFDEVLYASGIDRNVGYDPIEFFTFNPLSVGSMEDEINIQMSIQLVSGPPPKHMQLICFDCPSNVYLIFDYGTPGTSTSFGHANANLGAGVGAADFRLTPAYGVEPPIVETYSSFGGTPILFDNLGNLLPTSIVRKQPRFTGPDGGLTTFFPGGGDNRFTGSSASAPHVAAVAALLLQGAGGRRSLTPAAVYKILEDTAIDMEDTSMNVVDGKFDFNTGYGFVDALAAYKVVLDRPTPTPPIKTPMVTPMNAPVRKPNIPVIRPVTAPIRRAPIAYPVKVSPPTKKGKMGMKKSNNY